MPARVNWLKSSLPSTCRVRARVRADHILEQADHLFRQLLLVDKRRVKLSVAQLDDRSGAFRAQRGRLCDACDRFQDLGRATRRSSLRTVICIFTSSGMMLCLVPPWIAPTVTTAGSRRVAFATSPPSADQHNAGGDHDRIDRRVGAAPCPLALTMMSTESTLACICPSR